MADTMKKIPKAKIIRRRIADKRTKEVNVKELENSRLTFAIETAITKAIAAKSPYFP